MNQKDQNIKFSNCNNQLPQPTLNFNIQASKHDKPNNIHSYPASQNQIGQSKNTHRMSLHKDDQSKKKQGHINLQQEQTHYQRQKNSKQHQSKLTQVRNEKIENMLKQNITQIRNFCQQNVKSSQKITTLNIDRCQMQKLIVLKQIENSEKIQRIKCLQHINKVNEEIIKKLRARTDQLQKQLSGQQIKTKEYDTRLGKDVKQLKKLLSQQFQQQKSQFTQTIKKLTSQNQSYKKIVKDKDDKISYLTKLRSQEITNLNQLQNQQGYYKSQLQQSRKNHYNQIKKKETIILELKKQSKTDFQNTLHQQIKAKSMILQKEYNKTIQNFNLRIDQLKKQYQKMLSKNLDQNEKQKKIFIFDNQTEINLLREKIKNLQSENSNLKQAIAIQKEDINACEQNCKQLKRQVQMASNDKILYQIKSILHKQAHKQAMKYNFKCLKNSQLPTIIGEICNSFRKQIENLNWNKEKCEQLCNKLKRQCQVKIADIKTLTQELKVNRNIDILQFFKQDHKFEFDIGLYLNILIQQINQIIKSYKYQISTALSTKINVQQNYKKIKEQKECVEKQFKRLNNEYQSLKNKLEQQQQCLNSKELKLKSYFQQKQKQMNQTISSLKQQNSRLQEILNLNNLEKQAKIQRLIAQNQYFCSFKRQSAKSIQQLTKIVQKLQIDVSTERQNLFEMTSNIRVLTDQLQVKQNTLKNKQQIIKKMRDEAIQKQNILKVEFDKALKNQAQNICSALNKIFDSEPEEANFTSIVRFISQNINPSTYSFQVSHILQKLPKQRNYISSQCCKFLQCQRVTTKLLFKADQFTKNFANYLPSSSNKYIFSILFKTKNNSLFCILSQFLGKDASVQIINLNDKNVLKKSEKSRTSACSFENNVLKFGNNEIVIKNVAPFEISVNTLIIGQKYFTFKKEELLGTRDDSNPISLQAFEIHRIYVG